MPDADTGGAADASTVAPASPPSRYRAFISYSHVDRKIARWLMHKLEGYRVPKRLVGKATPYGPVPPKLGPIFRDRDELASASDLGERITSVLRESAALIVICSPAAARSRWVGEEILAYKRIHGPDRVFCLIVDGDPQAGDDSQQCFPRPLRYRIDDDGQLSDMPIEPVAADIRAQGDGRRRSVMKLIAGLLGVGYDELVRRELVRRHRRMTAITIGAVAGMALASALAAVAYIARDDAERRRGQAEDLLGFLVEDMQERLSPLGRLDVLETVLDKTMEYFSGLGERDLTDTALARQAQAMVKIGEIRAAQGRYPEALESFRRAYGSSAELVRHDPDSQQLLFDRGQAEFWVGWMHWREDQLDEAQVWLTRYRDTALQLVALDATNPDWITETVYGYHNLAVLEIERGRLKEADEMFESEIVMMEGLLQSDEDNATLRYDLSDAISWRGTIASMLGDLDRSQQLKQKSLSLLEYLVSRSPGNKNFVSQMLVARFLVIRTLIITGRVDEARQMLEQNLAAQRNLVRHDPQNKDWLLDLIRTQTTLAGLLLAGGELSPATALAEEATGNLQRLAERLESSPAFTRRKVASYAVNIRLRLRTAEFDAARALMSEALQAARSTQPKKRVSPDDLAMLAGMLILAGELEWQAEDPQAARALWLEASRLLQPVATESRNFLILDPWIRAQLWLGQKETARPFLARLDASGYRPLEPWPEI
ncbi:MAG: TIR domain-containing protein [Gammaproteobacteria bacterium]